MTTNHVLPIAARAYPLQRLADLATVADDLPEALRAEALALARQGETMLAELVHTERGYRIGDTVRDVLGRRLLVHAFTIPAGFRHVNVLLKPIRKDGEPSILNVWYPLDAQFDRVAPE